MKEHTHKEYGYARIKVEKTGKVDADRLFEGIEMEEDGGLQVGFSPGVAKLDKMIVSNAGISGVDVSWRSIDFATSAFYDHRFDVHFSLHCYFA